MPIEWTFVILAALIFAVVGLLHRFWPKRLARMTAAKIALLCFALAALAAAFASLISVLALYVVLGLLVVSAVASSYFLRIAVREYYNAGQLR